MVVNQISKSTYKFVITENYLEIVKRQICVCHFKQQSLAFTNEVIEVSLLAIRLFRSHLAKFSQERSHVTGGKSLISKQKPSLYRFRERPPFT